MGKSTMVDRLSIVVSRVTMFLFIITVGAIFYEVVARYVFNSPTIWASELSLFLAGIGYLFAGLFAMQQREHIRITTIYDIAPRRLQRVFDVIALGCVLSFMLGMVIGGFESAWGSLSTWERYGTAWNPPIPAVLKPLILVVAVLIAIQAVNNFIVDRKSSR